MEKLNILRVLVITIIVNIIDKEFFEGYKGDISRTQISKLRKDAGVYTTGIFFEELKEVFRIKGFKVLEFKVIDSGESDQDPRIIEIYYPNIIKQPTEYVLPRVQIEISCRSLREPFSIQTFGAIVDEFYEEKDFTKPFFITYCKFILLLKTQCLKSKYCTYVTIITK